MGNIDEMLNEIFEDDSSVDELFDEKPDVESYNPKVESYNEPNPVDELFGDISLDDFEEEEPLVEETVIEEPEENLDLTLSTYLDEEPKEEPAEAVEEEPLKVIEEAPMKVIAEKPKKVSEEKGTVLETYPGRMETIRNFVSADPVPAEMNIVRKNGDTYELLAVAPMKVIECDDENAKLLVLDHIMKTQKISGEDKKSILGYEVLKKEKVSEIFGKNVAELNGMTEAELTDFLMDIPAETKAIVNKLSKELGMEIKITPELAKAKTEVDVLKALLKERGTK